MLEFARFLLESPAPTDPTVEYWAGLVGSLERRTIARPSRSPQTDAAVSEFIQNALKDIPTASRSKLLALFRATGRACEQKRFGELFMRTKLGAKRKSMTKKKVSLLRRRALRIEQCEGHPLYLLCLTGEEVLTVADIHVFSR